jgi:uncharacterized phage protein (TIGR01671 family)
MRQIEFRGKRIDNGDWVTGTPFTTIPNTERTFMLLTNSPYNDEVSLHGKKMFVAEDYSEVIPESVGQFTGLLDKSGTKIFDGDILRFPAKDEWDKINYSCFEVFFHDGDANSDYNIGYSMNRMYNHGSVCGGYTPSFKPKPASKMEVIGNIHDNPELLK